MNEKPWLVLPQKFLDRLPGVIPTEKLDDVLESFCVKKPSTFRTNTLKITTRELERKLLEEGFEFEKISWYNDAFILKNRPQKELTMTSLYKDGLLYIQGLSSMIPALVLNPSKDEIICDLTAAPGSKTTQIAMMMSNSGKIIANDISRIRLLRLEANLKIQGVTNTQITSLPGQIFWQKYPSFFDRTLVDVPCSLEGTFYCHYPKSFRDWSPRKVDILSQKQKFLLRSAFSVTKPGGLIVYSTCTLEVDENEAVIDWLIKKEGDKVELVDILIPGLELLDGIVEYKGKKLYNEIKKTKRILPSHFMEGFFVAAFIKK